VSALEGQVSELARALELQTGLRAQWGAAEEDALQREHALQSRCHSLQGAVGTAQDATAAAQRALEAKPRRSEAGASSEKWVSDNPILTKPTFASFQRSRFVTGCEQSPETPYLNHRWLRPFGRSRPRDIAYPRKRRVAQAPAPEDGGASDDSSSQLLSVLFCRRSPSCGSGRDIPKCATAQVLTARSLYGRRATELDPGA